MAYKTVLFDMDGTLLDTLEDLRDSTNYVLRKLGHPERSLEETRRFVGNGAEKLIRRAMPENTAEEEIQTALGMFRTYYEAHCKVKTKVYDGMLEVLDALRAHGVKTAVVSNKPDEAVKKLTDRERHIIRLRFYEGKTQMEVARLIRISQAQVSRLEKSALKTLRNYLR